MAPKQPKNKLKIPLPFKEAIRDALKVKPPEKKPTSKKEKERKSHEGNPFGSPSESAVY